MGSTIERGRPVSAQAPLQDYKIWLSYAQLKIPKSCSKIPKTEKVLPRFLLHYISRAHTALFCSYAQLPKSRPSSSLLPPLSGRHGYRPAALKTTHTGLFAEVTAGVSFPYHKQQLHHIFHGFSTPGPCKAPFRGTRTSTDNDHDGSTGRGGAAVPEQRWCRRQRQEEASGHAA